MRAEIIKWLGIGAGANPRSKTGRAICDELVAEGLAYKEDDGYWATADLRRAKAATKMGAESSSRSTSKVGKKRGPIKNLDNPLGQFAQFLVHSADRRSWSPENLHDEMVAHGFTRTNEAVRKWLNGTSAPRLGDLHFVALALGYDDWLSLISAVAKFHKRTK